MKQLLIIPDRTDLKKDLELAKKFNLGFEYNDFFSPAVLNNEAEMEKIIKGYKGEELPDFCTCHGAFLDVIPFSPDPKIREISNMRIEQSIEAAKKIGAKAVVFHTNYNPFLNSGSYMKSWIETNAAYWSEVLKRHENMNIYLENMFDTSPDALEELSERLAGYGNYGVCLDYAHASLSDVDTEIWAKRLGRFVKHIHINDNDRVSDLHLAWGDGILERDKFYSCFKEYMGGATILLETPGMENKIRTLEVLKNEGFLDGVYNY